MLLKVIEICAIRSKALVQFPIRIL